ncbi:MAG: NAD-dependent epimerase/dehydratase family protein [Cytophagales bacterium]|nr:MAG: NAD-dependent epimerase/dehydratase family protein [Cytophagales bacterium]
MYCLENASVCITGGTGTLGRALVKLLLTKYSNTIKKLVIFSRDEFKQYEMAQIFPPNLFPIEYIIGDVKDKQRLLWATQQIDILIHLAALKRIETAEKNPYEAFLTNVVGTQNVVEVAGQQGIKKILLYSTDKASSPNSVYGATKLCAEKLFLTAQNTTATIIRGGNLLGSRGSVVPLFLEKRKEGFLPITDVEMTRFSFLPEEAAFLALEALENTIGGEIFVPKLPSYRIVDIAEAIAPDSQRKIIGRREGEKKHDEMIANHEAFRTIENEKYYLIVPFVNLATYLEQHEATMVMPDFSYQSDNNTNWLTVEQIRRLIVQYIDADFQPLL